MIPIDLKEFRSSDRGCSNLKEVKNKTVRLLLIQTDFLQVSAAQQKRVHVILSPLPPQPCLYTHLQYNLFNVMRLQKITQNYNFYIMLFKSI